MNQSIIELLSEDNDAYTKKDLKKILGIEEEELDKDLEGLEETGIVYHTKDDKYTLFSNSRLLKGYIEMHNDKLCVHVDEGYVEIKDSKANDLRLYDFVAIDYDKYNLAGKVVKILKKNDKPIVSELLSDKGNHYVIDENAVIKKKILVKCDDTKCASLGSVVLVKDGIIKKVIGHINEPDTEIKKALYMFGFDPEYSEEVMMEVENDIPDHIDAKDYPDFVDLRNMPMVTIDCDSTKDIDDGAYAERVDDDTIRVYIPIAIETEFIKEGSAIEKDIFERGTSVYVEDTVCALMHTKLSNGICSLNEGEDRLSLTCSFEIDKNGKIRNAYFFDAIVRSSKKMKYSDVNKILEEGIVPEGYEEYVDNLKLLNIASVSFYKKLYRDGFLDFASREGKCIYEKGNPKPIGISVQYQRTAERLIEFLMLAHNSSLASYLFHRGVGCIYRVDKKANQERLAKAFECYITKGYYEKARKYYASSDMQKVLTKAKGKPDEYAMSNIGIRAQSKAKFSEVNIGHAPTAQKIYAQESSGIRRAGDFVNQRIARDTKQYGAEYAKRKYNKDLLATLAANFTQQEILAEKCENYVHKRRLAYYMEDKIDEEYEGIITGFVDSGMFIELDNTVEGYVPFSSMKDDHYLYNQNDFRAYGKETKKIYMLGDSVSIKVKRADHKTGEVDFRLVDNKLEKKDTEIKKRIKKY